MVAHTKNCKTCKLARELKTPRVFRCRIPLFARITKKGKKEYCEDWEPIPGRPKKKVKETDA